MSGARVPFAAARDGLFFRRMADVHPRFQSPSTSLIVQALLTTGLLLAVGRFQQLFELAIFAEWLFYMITATTIFIYRRRETDEKIYHVWGYPVVPALFVAAAAVLLVYSYAENLKNSLIGTGIILLGIPLFLLFRKGGRQPTEIKPHSSTSLEEKLLRPQFPDRVPQLCGLFEFEFLGRLAHIGFQLRDVAVEFLL